MTEVLQVVFRLISPSVCVITAFDRSSSFPCLITAFGVTVRRSFVALMPRLIMMSSAATVRPAFVAVSIHLASSLTGLTFAGWRRTPARLLLNDVLACVRMDIYLNSVSD